MSSSRFDGTADVACNSTDSSVASTLVVASGLPWRCHSVHNAENQVTFSSCFFNRSVCVVLVGLMD